MICIFNLSSLKLVQIIKFQIGMEETFLLKFLPLFCLIVYIK